MKGQEYVIGADYVYGKGWGTYAVCRGIVIVQTGRLECKSVVEFKSRLKSIANSLEAPVKILIEDEQ
jgi:hypothetical protein